MRFIGALRLRYSSDGTEVLVDPKGRVEVVVVPDPTSELTKEDSLLEKGRSQGIEECLRFLEEEANKADCRADYGGALVIRKVVKKLLDRLKP